MFSSQLFLNIWLLLGPGCQLQNKKPASSWVLQKVALPPPTFERSKQSSSAGYLATIQDPLAVNNLMLSFAYLRLSLYNHSMHEQQDIAPAGPQSAEWTNDSYDTSRILVYQLVAFRMRTLETRDCMDKRTQNTFREGFRAVSVDPRLP